MNKIKEIEALVSAIEKGSLAKAAQDEGVTPAMLGRRIDALEGRLGVKLVHRTTRHLTLTEQGALFLDSCHKILDEMEYAERQVSEGRNKATGQLSVYAPAAFGRRHVAPHARAFVAQHPGVHITFNLTTSPIDLVRERYDVGIRIGQDGVDPNFVAVKLAKNRRVICGTPAYLKRYGVPRRPEDLMRHNCLVFSSPSHHGNNWGFEEGGRPLTVRVGGNVGCNDGELLTHWALDGLGLARRSTWEVQPYLDSGQLMSVLDDYARPGQDVMAVYPPQRYLPAKVRFFISALRSIYAQPGYWSRHVSAQD
jgi:DNA-binding transcriptional LysR family regulator